MTFTNTNIKSIFTEFQSLKNYTDKVRVFYKGYTDLIQDQKPSFICKKKFIELCLYAQGILFARHLVVPGTSETSNTLTYNKT
jgi:hypothetical protein